jgi:hypothetical protein
MIRQDDEEVAAVVLPGGAMPVGDPHSYRKRPAVGSLLSVGERAFPRALALVQRALKDRRGRAFGAELRAS